MELVKTTPIAAYCQMQDAPNLYWEKVDTWIQRPSGESLVQRVFGGELDMGKISWNLCGMATGFFRKPKNFCLLVIFSGSSRTQGSSRLALLKLRTPYRFSLCISASCILAY